MALLFLPQKESTAQYNSHPHRPAPLKYVLHRKKINTLVSFFDSISQHQLYAIGLTMVKDEIEVKADYSGKNRMTTLNLTDLSAQQYLDSVGMGFNNVLKIKKLLEETHTISISNSMYGTARTIQINLSCNIISDNYRGLVFIENKTDEIQLPPDLKKINSKLYYSRHNGTPFYF